MRFRSKLDRYFLTFLLIALCIIGAAFFIPLLLDEERAAGDITTVLPLFLVPAGLLLWTSFDITYIFYDDVLLLRAGPCRSRIRYEEITKVEKTRDILTGYRLLSSRDALEISYKSGLLGSVKISPKDCEQFQLELKKRCPNL